MARWRATRRTWLPERRLASLPPPSALCRRTSVRSSLTASTGIRRSSNALRQFEPALRLVRRADRPVERRRRRMRRGRHVTPQELATLEPTVTAANGGTLHAANGAVDAALLVQALRQAVSSAGSGTIVSDDPVRAVELSNALPAVLLESGRSCRRSDHRARRRRLVAGNWRPAAAASGDPPQGPDAGGSIFGFDRTQSCPTTSTWFRGARRP